MANRNNSSRTKKSHSYRPYDTSNSFVKRITAKVSEILPQPTSWVSRWFSPAPKLNVRERENLDEDDDDEEERQPPPKRFCFSADTHDFSHQNNINRISDLDRESGELSPILSNRIVEDGAIPGPSGLHLRHFVSSTPAIRPATPFPPVKVSLRERARDDASDESESTSGCSSLVPGAERPHTRQEQHPTTPTNSQNITSGGSSRRFATSQLKTSVINRTSSMNISNSSQPAFDTYVFNNPLNRSGIRKNSISDSSCFYPGNTTFGGASARLTPNVEQTRVISVKASPTKQVAHDTLGASALRILRALEQFSTPVLDAKRIPVNQETPMKMRKRKVTQPYEELIYPSMPDLLRVKRQEQALKAEAERNAATTQQQALSSALLLPISSGGPSTSSSCSTTTSSYSQTPSCILPSKQPQQPNYAIRKDNTKEKYVSSIKGRKKDDEEYEIETVPEVNLPNVKLQLTSLPKFDLNVPILSKETPQLKPPPTNNPPFKFSEPEVAKVLSTKNTETVNTFTFSKPLEPHEFSKALLPSCTNSAQKPSSSLEISVNTPGTNLKGAITTGPNLNFKFEPKNNEKNKFTTVDNFREKSIIPNKKSSTSGDSSWICSSCNKTNKEGEGKCFCGKEKLSSILMDSERDSWKCKKCALKNSSLDNKCKSCASDKNKNDTGTTFKGFEGFKKPQDMWECKECYSSNKNTLDKCAACSTPKASNKPVNNTDIGSSTSAISKPFESKTSVSGTKPLSTAPLLNSFKKPEGTWECSTCLVNNKKDDTSCVACSTSKPGCKSSEKVPSAFTFGNALTSSSENKTFQFKAEPTPKFTFGIPAENKNSNGSSNFKFHNESKNEVPKVTAASTVSSSIPLVNSINKAEGSWECGTCLIRNKKESSKCEACSTSKPGSVGSSEKEKSLFSFGIPTATTSLPNNIQFGTVNSGKTNNLNAVQPEFSFRSAPDSADKAFSNQSMFGFSSTDTKPSKDFQINENHDFKNVKFGFINSEETKEKESLKLPATNMFTFGNVGKENKNEEISDNNDKPPKKKVSFGNPLTQEKTISNDINSTTSFGSLVPHKSNEISSTNNFSFTSKVTPFENAGKKDPPAASTNALFTFGGTSNVTKSNELIPISEPAKPVITFASQNPVPASSEIPNSSSMFGSSLTAFKPSETESKPFSFQAISQTTNHSGGGFSFNPVSAEFGSQQNQNSPAAPFFGVQSAPMFAPQTQQQEPKPFVFGAVQPPTAQQQPQQSIFAFNAPPAQAPASGLGSNPSAFGGFSAGSTTPKFDPNVKPTFNFTGGATPLFSATPNPLETGVVDSKRKVRKAIRRTQQR